MVRILLFFSRWRKTSKRCGQRSERSRLRRPYRWGNYSVRPPSARPCSLGSSCSSRNSSAVSTRYVTSIKYDDEEAKPSATGRVRTCDDPVQVCLGQVKLRLSRIKSRNSWTIFLCIDILRHYYEFVHSKTNITQFISQYLWPFRYHYGHCFNVALTKSPVFSRCSTIRHRCSHLRA